MSKPVIEILITEIARIFIPFQRLNNYKRITSFVSELGWEFNEGVELELELTGLINSVQLLIGKVNELSLAQEDEEKLRIVMEISEEMKFFLNELDKVLPDLERLINNLPDLITGITADVPTLLKRLLDYLIYQYCQTYRPRLFAVLHIFGILEMQDDDAQMPIKTVHWGRIPKLFYDQNKIFNEVYNWNSTDPEEPNINSKEFFSRIEIFMRACLIPGGIYTQTDSIRKSLGRTEEDNKEIRMPIFQGGVWPDSYMELDLNFCPIPTQGAKQAGFALYPYFFGNFDIVEEVAENWLLNLGGSIKPKDADLCLKFRAPHELELVTDLFNESPTNNYNGAFEVGLTRKSSPGSMIYIFGQENGSHLALKKASVKFKANSQRDTTEFSVVLKVHDFTVAINPGEDGDGFIQKLLSGISIKSVSDLGIGVSNIQGVFFEGSSALEIKIPTHLELGPLNIDSVTVGIGIDNVDFDIRLGSDFSASLGPLFIGVENMGLAIPLSFPGNGGNLGPMQIDAPKFKPPKGVGLSLDVGVVKGGGYLYFDFDREEYAGALELIFSEWIAIKAIGLVTTKLPDGSKGFSLLIILTVEFGSGIQLGFGFALLGVGGILGLSRTVKIEPLTEGVRTGAIESVMFPQNVIENAPRIISDLRRFFPPAKDLFLVGPMAKIGYGTPTLISVSLGVILEFPEVNITILGVLKVALPTEDTAIIRIQVNFIGRLEPSNQLMWFYAQLFDSRVLFITLEGGMGLLVNWSDNASFVVSVGGFHPKYNPPPLPFPEPPRIAINILNEPQAKVRIEGYFAVTSNAVMFGAKVEIFFGVSDFNIDGHLAFDALFQFNPFFFSFSLSFGLSVKVFGAGLFSVNFNGLLEGPTPWYIEGNGEISLLFFSISVPFDHTWGESKNTKLDPIEVFPIIEQEFNALTNWQAVLPASNNILVSLRKLGNDEDSQQLVLHPVGKLRISQRKIPINFNLEKVGNQSPSDVNKISVEASIPGSSLARLDAEEKFAIGQFKDLDNSKKISSPAFQLLDGGIEIAIAGEQLKTSKAVKRVIRYETSIIDNNFGRYTRSSYKYLEKGFALLHSILFGHFLKGGAVAKSTLSNQYKKRMAPFDELVQVKDNQYSVAFNTNNKPYDSAAVSFSSQIKAQEYMEQEIQVDPNLVNNLHVIPNTELNLIA